MPAMLACLTKSLAGGKTRFSCSTVSMFDDIAPPQGSRQIECYSCTPAFKRNEDGTKTLWNERGARPAASARLHLCQPLAAASALPRPDPRARRLRMAVLAGALLPPARRLRQR